MPDRVVKTLFFVWCFACLFLLYGGAVGFSHAKTATMVAPSGPLLGNDTLRFEFASANYTMVGGDVANRVDFVGISLNYHLLETIAKHGNVSVQHSLNALPALAHPISIHLKIVGRKCSEGKETKVFYNDAIRITGPLLALVTPVDCSLYSVILNSPATFNTIENPALLFETTDPKFHVLIVMGRVTLGIIFLLVAFHRIVCYSGDEIGSKSSILCSLAVVLAADPVSYWKASSIRWLCSSAAILGNGVAPLMFIRELFDDLRRCCKSIKQDRFHYILEILPFIVLLCTNIWASIEIAAIQRDHPVVGLAEIYLENQLWFQVCKIVASTVLAIYLLFQVVRLWYVYRRLNEVPYSVCRCHYIVFSFNLFFFLLFEVIFLVVGVLMVVFSILYAYTNRNAFRTTSGGPWMDLNESISRLLLPGGGTFGVMGLEVPWAFALSISFLLNCTPAATNYNRENRTLTLSDSIASGSPLLVRLQEANTFRSLDFNLETLSFHSTTSFAGVRIIPDGGSRSEQGHSMGCLSLKTIRLFAHMSRCHPRGDTPTLGNDFPGTETEVLWRITDDPFLLSEFDLDLPEVILSVRVIWEPRLKLHAFIALVLLPRVNGTSDPIKLIVVSFRGTSNWTNIVADLDIKLSPIEAPNMVSLAEDRGILGAKVHNGFQRAAMALRDRLMSEIEKCIEEWQVSTIWFTGHSLGGALSTLLATEAHLALRHRAFIGVCTFAAPRVGNHAFARLFRCAACVSYRIVYSNDPVPRFPKKWLQCYKCERYKHVTGLVRIYGNGHLVVNPNFLEDMLQKLIRRLTQWPTWACWCCYWSLGRMTLHRLPNYINALKAAQKLESNVLAEMDEEAGEIAL